VNENRKLLTVKDLATMLGIHQRTCWRLTAMAEADRSDFPRPLRIGPKTIRWRLADVEKYLETLVGASQ
jgi:predicted DNA-binding transcriptional regulator AlpA